MTTTDRAESLPKATAAWRALPRRWPTMLALASGVLVVGAPAQSLAGLLPVLPLVYLIVAAAGRRAMTWPALGLLMACYVATLVLGPPWPAVGLAAIAAATLAATVRHEGRRRSPVWWTQVAGMLVFGGLAAGAAVSTPEFALWLVAAGWFLHGVWDFAHLHADRVVSRSYAEWCGVLDMLVAAGLLLATR